MFQPRLTFALIALLSLCTINTAQAQENAKNTALKIGVIRLTDVFDGYKKTKTLDSKLNLELGAEKEKAKAMQQDLIQAEKATKNEMLAPMKRLEAREALEVKKLKFKLFRQKTLAVAERKQLRSISEVYSDISKAVKAYGDANGFDLILQLQNSNGKHRNYKELEVEINSTIVMHHSKRVDLTQAVIDALNKAFTP